MKVFLRLAADVAVDQVPPGTPGDWPMTRFCLQDWEDDPTEDGLLGPMTDKEADELIEARLPAWEAAKLAYAKEQTAFWDAQVLPDVRADKFKEIDQKTDAIISTGFTFAGKVFSLSLPAQMKMLGAFVARDLVSYPIVWNTADDLDTIELKDANEVAAMYAAAVEAVRVALDEGTLTKDLARAAESVADLKSIEDSR